VIVTQKDAEAGGNNKATAKEAVQCKWNNRKSAGIIPLKP